MLTNNKMLEKFRKRVNFFTQSQSYISAIILTAFLSYGYAIFNISLDVDDLVGDWYIGSGHEMLASGRWGLVFLARLIGYGNASPIYSFAIDLIAVLFLLGAAVLFCVLLEMVSHDRISLIGCTIFSCLFISYPLILEIWEYNGANVAVTCGYFLCGAALCLMYECLREKLSTGIKTTLFLIASALLTLICSSYESLAVVYVFLAFVILGAEAFYDGLSIKDTLSKGAKYAGALMLGCVSRVVVHLLILSVLRLPPATNGQTIIAWGTQPVPMLLTELAKAVFRTIGLSLLYPPFTTLLFAGVIFCSFSLVVTIKKKNLCFFLCAAGALGSLALLSLLQGTPSPFRCCQVYGVFTALAGLILHEALLRCGKKRWAVITVECVLILVCVHQAVYLSSILAANQARSDQELYVIQTIDYQVRNSCDTQNKTVAFVGEYALSGTTRSAAVYDLSENPLYVRVLSVLGREPKEVAFMETNLLSVINWGKNAWDGAGTELQRIFDYFGSDLTVETDADRQEQALQYAQTHEMPGYPHQGYIIELDDIIIVRLG